MTGDVFYLYTLARIKAFALVLSNHQGFIQQRRVLVKSARGDPGTRLPPIDFRLTSCTIPRQMPPRPDRGILCLSVDAISSDFPRGQC
ncbi:hypothetical protein CERZMDRAFT_90226 [Cercospora zeae-maydis SCOH1-5]|uniref:Uncharacterized protein n=1 Tax=Cercospora zeae-maydis SCOH1-5 TaxID=717836 RepID=A0A6A6FNE8_9PEZI|nr:hypothetical protein CERZMDRAFT_90226 [Cercospora zeae-maydis SCOH1-5]